MRELQRVLDEAERRRQVLVPCPRCGQHVGLWLCIQPPGEYHRDHQLVDVTASLLPPAERAEAMAAATTRATLSTATPWVTCSFCGYDDHYTFGAP